MTQMGENNIFYWQGIMQGTADCAGVYSASYL